MRVRVSRSDSISGSVSLPGDKSISHRAALLSALAEGESRFVNFLDAGVTRAMVAALKDLGVVITWQDHALSVQGKGFNGLEPHKKILNCGHSATTLRLLAGALTCANVKVVLDGSPGLRQRPMSRVVDPLTRMGAEIYSIDGCAPLFLSKREQGKSLRGIVHETPVASAQVKSAVLLAGLAAQGETVLIEPGPSRDHTERMLRAMGISIESSLQMDGRRRVILKSSQNAESLSPLQMSIPGDFSAGAFILVAGAILPGSRIKLRDIGLNETRTGLLDALQRMGAGIQRSAVREESKEQIGTVVLTQRGLTGIKVGGDLVVRMIDEFPAFAVAAALAKGRTVLRDAGELRIKESDRIRGICHGLSCLGVDIEERPDGFVIDGQEKDFPGGVCLDAGQDHRLAMAFVLAGLRAREPLVITEAEIIAQSFPGFISMLQELGVSSLEVLDE